MRTKEHSPTPDTDTGTGPPATRTPQSNQVDLQHRRRWWILAVIGLAQLMLVLDLTIVNVALPSAQHALGFSTACRQWIITAYALAFGSLLLLGGRLGDWFGRKWTLIAGLIGFAVVSAVGGAAQSFGMLVAARGAQGVFGALLAPSALALLATTFTDPAERNKAFGVFGAIAGGGSAIGLLLGGMLTQAISWRATLFINLAIAIPVALAASMLLVNQRPPKRPALDLPGTITGPLGLFALVYGVSNAEVHSWTAPLTIISLAAAVALVAAFIAIESRVAEPLLPLEIVSDRARGSSYLALAAAGAASFGVFLFLTYFLQRTLGYSPTTTGLAFLPLTAALIVSSTITNIKLRPRFGPRPLIATGMLLGAGAIAWLAQLTPSSSYGAHVLPALVLLGLGLGATFTPAIFTATQRVTQQETGVASAMANTSQQVGGAVGAAALSTIFASAVTSYAHAHAHSHAVITAAPVDGYTVAFWVAAGVLAAGAIIVGALMPTIKVRASADHSSPASQPQPTRA